MAAHVGELSHAARDVDDAHVPVLAHERQDLLGEAPGSEEVRLERLANLVEVDVEGARAPAAAGHAGVVDEHVEAARILRDRGHTVDDALLVGDVELARGHVLAELACNLLTLREVAGADDDGVVASRELAGHFSADPAVAARDERDALHSAIIACRATRG